MKTQASFIILYRCITTLAVLSGAMLLYGLVWDYSTDRYLEGFADAVIPGHATAQEDAETLLTWFDQASSHLDNSADVSASRDPVVVLRYSRLLRACGTSVNAFVNLARAAGLKTRRLLLLDKSGNTMHVVSELYINNRWIIVDPVFRAFFRDSSGNLVTKQDLRDPKIFQDAIGRIPNYRPEYTFDRTSHVHLEHISVLGRPLRKVLDTIFPSWDDAADWGYLPEHPAIGLIVESLVLLTITITMSFALGRYGRNKFGIRSRVRNRVADAGRVLISGKAADSGGT
jgi:hypothetical protein